MTSDDAPENSPRRVNLSLLEYRVWQLERKSDRNAGLLITTMLSALGSGAMLLFSILSHGGR